MTQRVYMENPYLKELEAEVLDKRYKNNKYYIKLNKTIFYPHLSGGQPGDKGRINGVEVLEVFEENNEIIHVTKENITQNKVKMSIDWDRRLDLMQQHTGQHLLSSTFYRLYGGETVGFHIGNDYVYIDVTLSDLTEGEAEKIEILANKIITSNFNIKSYFVNKEELSTIPVRKIPSVDSNIRIVEIDGIDYSPCGGTHLGNTGELGLVKIRKWERYKGNIRVEFVCGKRALNDYLWKSRYIKELGLLFSSKDLDLINKIKKEVSEKESLAKENRDLKESIAQIKAESFIKDSKRENNFRIILKLLRGTGFREISSIASHLNNTYDNLIQIYGLKNDSKGQFYVAKSKDINLNLSDIYKKVAEKYSIKGGGNPNVVQGGADLDELNDVINEFYNVIKG